MIRVMLFPGLSYLGPDIVILVTLSFVHRPASNLVYVRHAIATETCLKNNNNNNNSLFLGADLCCRIILLLCIII